MNVYAHTPDLLTLASGLPIRVAETSQGTRPWPYRNSADFIRQLESTRA